VDELPESGGRPIEAREDHHCFGCGRLNPQGLRLSFSADANGSVFTNWTPEPVHQGYGGIVHGGIITTVLDEVMGWTLSNVGIWAVTARLNVSFRRPVHIAETVRARAWIVADHDRKVDLAGELQRLSDGTVLAEGTGVFVRVPEETAREWQKRYLP
jgi:acyl-coenzyme A thioesterase PaaI-like protein